MFEKILNGQLPNGHQVGDPETRDHGRDFTFSMPKSASLLAYVSGDKRILAAHMEAVKETMAWVESNLAEARIKVERLEGHHGSFWLQSPTYGKILDNPGEAGAEIDIIEYFGSGRGDRGSAVNITGTRTPSLHAPHPRNLISTRS